MPPAAEPPTPEERAAKVAELLRRVRGGDATRLSVFAAKCGREELDWPVENGMPALALAAALGKLACVRALLGEDVAPPA